MCKGHLEATSQGQEIKFKKDHLKAARLQIHANFHENFENVIL
jgi:hypothetical protein